MLPKNICHFGNKVGNGELLPECAPSEGGRRNLKGNKTLPHITLAHYEMGSVSLEYARNQIGRCWGKRCFNPERVKLFQRVSGRNWRTPHNIHCGAGYSVVQATHHSSWSRYGQSLRHSGRGHLRSVHPSRNTSRKNGKQLGIPHVSLWHGSLDSSCHTVNTLCETDGTFYASKVFTKCR